MAGAVSAGLVVGSLGRHLPVRLALAVIPGADAGRCGMEEALSCAFENLPTAIGQAIKLGILVVVLCAVLTAVGGVSIIVGLQHIRRRSQRPPMAAPEVPPQATSDWLGLGLVGVGSSLVGPGIWLAGSFLVFLVS